MERVEAVGPTAKCGKFESLYFQMVSKRLLDGNTMSSTD